MKLFDKAFPYYLAIGMSAKEYWYEDCRLVIAYRKAHQMRRQMRNEDMWIQGLYNYEAVLDVAPILRAFSKARKPQPYRTEPIPFFEDEESERRRREKEQKSDEKAKSVMEIFMLSNNERFKNRQAQNG